MPLAPSSHTLCLLAQIFLAQSRRGLGAAELLHLNVEIAERPPVYRVPCIRQQYIIYMYTCSAPAHDCRIISWQRLLRLITAYVFCSGFSRLMLF